MTSFFPLLASEAPAALRYGVYTISVFALLYVFGGRYILKDKERNDVAAAIAIVVSTGVLGVILLSSVSLDAILSYLYGIVLGASFVYLLVKYRRLTAE